MADTNYVCVCCRVTMDQVKDAVKSGAKTFEEVQKITGCSQGCGRCKDGIVRLVNYLVQTTK